jgi:RNA polymerase sigma factor (sigma-70 family)
MATDGTNPLLQHLRRLALTAKVQEASDHELMESFVSAKNDAAFTGLLQRHGPMVLNLCRRVLRNEQDAEDAFQATFLVFARRATTLRARDAVSSWLYGVGYRTALKARSAAARRRARERTAPVRASADPLAEITVQEAQSIVDLELAELPEKYRAPLVLCCLEGLARDEAARQLGWTLSLFKSRLEQARELLRGRLSRRGLTLPAGMLSLGLLGTAAQAAVPAGLAAATIKAAALVAAGAAAAPAVSTEVDSLAQGVVRAMQWAKVKVALVAVLVLAVAGIGAFGVVHLRAGSSIDVSAPETPGVQALSKRFATPVAGPDKRQVQLKPESLQRWGRAEAVFTARLVKVVGGPVAQSEPPVFNHTLYLQVEKVLRGLIKKGDPVTAAHSARQHEQPMFPEGKDCLIAATFSRDRWVAQAVQELKAEDLAQAELACSVPLGWSLEAGLLHSPWATLGSRAWPALANGRGPVVCAATGRPALFVGDGIEFKAEPVPPKVKLQYGNPDGDGEFQVSVTNVTDKPVSVPALLSDGRGPLWDESLVILCQGKVYTAPGAQGLAKPAQPTVLKPGESSSGVINVLKLQGPDWPKGGYRIEFQLCLGEKSATMSFYYLSRHHDPLREKAAAER